MEVQSPHIILTDCGEAWTIVICWVSMRNLTSTSFLDITQKGVRLLTWSTRIFFRGDWLELYHLKVFSFV